MSNTAQSLASTRIASLLDENSFVEIGGQITARSTDFNMAGMETPSDGVITGYGVINGSLVYVYSQDASVMGGTIGEMHAKKIARLYEFAQKTGAPVIGLVDCAGMRLQEATDALNGFGEIYMAQAMASGVIPQITAVFGTHPGYDRLHIHGVQKRKAFRKLTKCTGRKPRIQMRYRIRRVPG